VTGAWVCAITLARAASPEVRSSGRPAWFPPGSS